MSWSTMRTYGGSGRHAIAGDGVRVKGNPDDIRKVLRRHGVAPTFDTLDIDPAYIGAHRAIDTVWRLPAGVGHAFQVNR